jgi:RNA polymerase sigma-70 factor (ECF subfamily)
MEPDSRSLRKSNASELSENETVRSAQQGNSAAFELLYQLHNRRVYSLCLRMVNNPTEAEDLTQEAFLQTFRKIQTFRGESCFSTWLHRLTVNIVLMKLRQKKHVEISLYERAEPEEESSKPLVEVGGPDLGLSGLIDRLNLRKAIDQLPDGYKKMFILHDIEGYNHKEIAGMLGCSIGNTKSQLSKARLRLRKLLHQAFHHGALHEPKSPRSQLATERWCQALASARA